MKGGGGGEGCQIDPPPPSPEKTTLIKPSLIRVNCTVDKMDRYDVNETRLYNCCS